MIISVHFPTLKNDADGVVYNLPLGVPDPNNSGKRIRREGAEQSLCFFVASQAIRKPCDASHPTEKALVKMLTEQAAHEATLTSVNSIIAGKNREHLHQLNKTTAKQHIQHQLLILNSLEYRKKLMEIEAKKGNPLDEAFLLKQAPGRIELLAKFIKNDKFETLYDYCWDLKIAKRGQIQLVFYRTIDPSPKSLVSALCYYSPPADALAIEKQNDIEKLPLVNWVFALQKCIQITALAHYELKMSMWQPKADFSVLLKELKDKGPLCISGHIGRYIYFQEPAKTQEVWGQRQVYEWPPEAKKGQVKDISHVVTVIGAVKGSEQAGGGNIYFLDPNDPSDPADPTLEKIYKISYKNLQESTTSLNAEYVKGTNLVRPYGYAWHSKEG